MSTRPWLKDSRSVSLEAPMPLRIPTATCRLQFNQQFRFQDARSLVGYLHELGVTDLYVSPLLQARRGSLHYLATLPSLTLPAPHPNDVAMLMTRVAQSSAPELDVIFGAF